jgi:hypothetical protein
MTLLALLFRVMDKEPSLFEVWVFFLSVALVGFLLCLWRSWMLLIVLPVVLLFAAAVWFELNDKDVGPAILAEAGQSYVTQSYVAMIIALVLPPIGAARVWMRDALRLLRRKLD